MCGRYYIDDEKNIEEIHQILKDISEKLRTDPMTSQLKTGEIFPTNVVPILTKSGARAMSWGFPRWDGKGTIINARAETAFDKNMFRKSLMERRCVIPSTGFFEWKAIEGQKKKDKYIINRESEKALYMAGFYSVFKDENGIFAPSFIILTTAANLSMTQIHNRMPVILEKSELIDWMNDGCDVSNFLNKAEPELVLQKIG